MYATNRFKTWFMAVNIETSNFAKTNFTVEHEFDETGKNLSSVQVW